MSARKLMNVPWSAEEFKRRAEPEDLPEWMDGPCSYEEFRACLMDLERVNRLLGAYRPTLGFLGRVAEQRGAAGTLRIVDVGCGGGDMLRQIARWARRRGVTVELTGLDLNPYAARAAEEFCAVSGETEIRWLTADAFSYDPPEGVDVVLSSLFTHHLPTCEVERFVGWMERTARVGWFVNDLQRSATAARWFSALAAGMRWHPFVRHDGPVSLRRAFRREDWAKMLAEAGVPEGAARIEEHAMSRLCVARLR